MEYYEALDRHGEPLNKTYERGQLPDPGEFMPITHVWIQNLDGRFLIQQRAKTTDQFPYQWATTSGLIALGDTPIKAALRETEEELGLTLSTNDLKEIRRVITTKGKYPTITYVYLFVGEINPSILSIDPLEVKAIAFQDLNTIKNMVVKDMFWNYPKLLFDEDYFSSLER